MTVAEQDLIMEWKAGRKGAKPLLDEEAPAKLFDIVTPPTAITLDVLNALWAFLDACQYVPDRVHIHREMAVTHAEVKALYFIQYAGWSLSRATGKQVFRTGRKKLADTKDASWAMVSTGVSCGANVTHLMSCNGDPVRSGA